MKVNMAALYASVVYSCGKVLSHLSHVYLESLGECHQFGI